MGLTKAVAVAIEKQKPRHLQALPEKGLPSEAVPLPARASTRNGLSPFFRYPGKGFLERVQGQVEEIDWHHQGPPGTQ